MRKPGEWQTCHVVWTAPTFNADGSVKTPAYVTAFHNGILVQDHVELKGETGFRAQVVVAGSIALSRRRGLAGRPGCRHNDHMGAIATVGARELKTRLGRYLNRVRRGETLVVTDRSEPVAELRPIDRTGDPVEATLAKLAASGGLTLPTRKGLVDIGAARITSGSGAAAVSADRDERG